MRIRKTYQGVVPTGKVLNSESYSKIDTYSCDCINNNFLNRETFKSYSAAGETVSVPNYTSSTKGIAVTSLKLPVGEYLIFVWAGFAANSSGWRRLQFSSTSGNTNGARYYSTDAMGHDGQTNQLTLACYFNVTAERTYYVNLTQTSGEALNGYASITALKIK